MPDCQRCRGTDGTSRGPLRGPVQTVAGCVPDRARTLGRSPLVDLTADGLARLRGDLALGVVDHVRELAQTDLLVREVARGIGLPQVAGGGLGAHAEVAAADLQPLALGATALNVRALVLQALHELAFVRVARYGGAYLRERPLTDVAEGEVAPELVGVDLAVPAHAADAVAGRVALVPLQ